MRYRLKRRTQVADAENPFAKPLTQFVIKKSPTRCIIDAADECDMGVHVEEARHDELLRNGNSRGRRRLTALTPALGLPTAQLAGKIRRAVSGSGPVCR